MKCPLIVAGYKERMLSSKDTASDCLKADCAWWLEDISMCALRDLALELRYTQQRLQDIAKAIPHWRQFTR